MTQVNGEKLMNAMNGFLNDAAKESSDAEIALPFEAFEDYSTDPVSFNDQSKLMLEKVDAVFDLAVKYNRRSSQYLKACGQLEQGIKYLASGCVTKIALEAKKHELPDLSQLSTDKLFRMTSYHYRKIDRALSDYIREKNGEVDDALLDMEFRFYNLLNRLRSTEVKIHDYNKKRYCGEEDYSPVIGGLAFTEKSWNRSFNEDHIEPASFQRARAFSAKSEIGNQKSEIGSENEEGRMKKEEEAVDDTSHFSLLTPNSSEAANFSLLTPNCSEAADSSLLIPNCSEAANSSLLTPNCGEAAGCGETELKHITEYSPYIDILKKAVMRVPQDSEHPDQIAYSFTTEEMILLSKDEEFAEVFPDMAAEIREEVKRWDDSG